VRFTSSQPQPIILKEPTFADYKCAIFHNTRNNKAARLSSIIRETAQRLNIQEENITVTQVRAKDEGIITNIYCEATPVRLTNSFIENFKKSKVNIEEKCEELKSEVLRKHAIDKQMQDQILVFLALAKGQSEIFTTELTDHTRAVMWLITLFGLAHIEYTDNLLKISPL
jgi:RNA 3'-terminal phosphate cyclase